MTESLFFSQIASKSIAASKKSGLSHAKTYQGDSSGFDKHLSLNDRGDNRGRDRDNVTDIRKEPKFTKETRDRDYGAPERQEPKIREGNTRQERTEHSENKTDARAEKTSETQENKSSAPENTDAEQTSPAKDANQPENAGETAQNADTNNDTTPNMTANTQTAELVEADGDEVSLEALVNMTEETSEGSGQEEIAPATETADIIPLFTQEAGEEAVETKTDTPQVSATAQQASLQQDTQITPEETAQAAIKQPKQTAQSKLEGHLDAKQTPDAAKPGLETALGKLQEAKPAESTKLEVAEVKNASKNASFLGEVNIEAAQKADKTDIKARIGDLAQKAVSGPVATTAQAKPAMSTLQMGASKIDAIGQIQPMNGETALTGTHNTHSVHVRFGSLPQTTQTAQIPVTTMAFHIAKSVENGVNRFEIRIDPPELGRVDVKLEVNQAGRVVANLTVDRPETLDLLQRDQRALERALQDAGLDVGGDSLNFSLKDQNANASDDNDMGTSQLADTADVEDDIIEPEMITGYVSNTGVDIRI